MPQNSDHNYCFRIWILTMANLIFFLQLTGRSALTVSSDNCGTRIFLNWMIGQSTNDSWQQLAWCQSDLKKMMCSWIFYHITLFLKWNSWSFASSFLWHNLFHFSLALRANIVEASHGAWVNFSCISKRWETYIIMGAHAFASSKLHHMLLVVLEIVNTNDQLRLKG